MEKAEKAEKAPPPDPTCPICKKAAHVSRSINALVEFWECEDQHMFVVDKKPPPRGANVPKPAPAPVEAEAPSEPKPS